jgi:hypothetical protein
MIDPNDYGRYWHEIKAQVGTVANIALGAYSAGAII